MSGSIVAVQEVFVEESDQKSDNVLDLRMELFECWFPHSLLSIYEVDDGSSRSFYSRLQPILGRQTNIYILKQKVSVIVKRQNPTNYQ